MTGAVRAARPNRASSTRCRVSLTPPSTTSPGSWCSSPRRRNSVRHFGAGCCPLRTRHLSAEEPGEVKGGIMTQHYVHQPQQNRSFPTWATILIVIASAFVLLCGAFMLLGVFASIASDDAAPRPTESVTEVEKRPTESATEVEENAPLAITVTDVYTEKNSFGDLYTAIRVEVHNNGNQRVYVGPLDWYVIDTGGFKFDATYGPFRTREARLPGVYLDPGQATTGVFHVEGEVDVATVVYQRWSWDDPVAVDIN